METSILAIQGPDIEQFVSQFQVPVTSTNARSKTLRSSSFTHPLCMEVSAARSQFRFLRLRKSGFIHVASTHRRILR